jgi:hypothetical protein
MIKAYVGGGEVEVISFGYDCFDVPTAKIYDLTSKVVLNVPQYTIILKGE